VRKSLVGIHDDKNFRGFKNYKLEFLTENISKVKNFILRNFNRGKFPRIKKTFKGIPNEK